MSPLGFGFMPLAEPCKEWLSAISASTARRIIQNTVRRQPGRLHSCTSRRSFLRSTPAVELRKLCCLAGQILHRQAAQDRMLLDSRGLASRWASSQSCRLVPALGAGVSFWHQNSMGEGFSHQQICKMMFSLGLPSSACHGSNAQPDRCWCGHVLK